MLSPGNTVFERLRLLTAELGDGPDPEGPESLTESDLQTPKIPETLFVEKGETDLEEDLEGDPEDASEEDPEEGSEDPVDSRAVSLSTESVDESEDPVPAPTVDLAVKEIVTRKRKGRPRILSDEERKATQIFLTDNERKLASKIGNGSMAEGLRKALHAYVPE
jgi:hypothetical protein